MWRSLFRRKRAGIDQPVIPDGVRVYAVGDIHGRVDLLRTLHQKIGADARGAPGLRKIVVYLGDYVDRGSDSRGVIDLLLDAPVYGCEIHYLSGNHEEMMLAFLDDAAMGSMWMFNGGDATLLSYGCGVPGDLTGEARMMAMSRTLREKLPPRHLEFLRNLELYHVEGGYLFVHAGIAPGRALEDQTSQDMLWIRDEFLRSTDDFGHCVVHGHSITDEPEFRPNRIGIDTGAFFSNVLTCLVLEGTEQRLLQS